MIILRQLDVPAGILGRQLFTLFSAGTDAEVLKGTQAFILAFLLLIVLFRKKLPDWEVENLPVSSLIGLILGLWRLSSGSAADRSIWRFYACF